MIIKRPPDPRRLRSLPPRGFGWIDHRLLRAGYLQRASSQALALYCLLVCASDQAGLSYYSDARLCELLRLEGAALCAARRELIALSLLAYKKPIFQLLALQETTAALPAPEIAPAPPSPRTGGQPPAPEIPPMPPLPAGVSLREMVAASLRKGGAA